MMNNSNHSISFSQYIAPELLADIRQQMLAFARLQLKDPDLAEDVVQDALVSALKHADQFQGKSAFKSWVFAILKNKIVDAIRQDSKYANLSSLSHDEGYDEALLDSLFDEAKHWHKGSMPKQFDDSWCNPEQSAHSAGFWQVFEACLNHLPSQQAQVFLMREYMELETTEICQTLSISSSHYYVLMHRSRLQLQNCLSKNWFDEHE